MKKLLLVAAVTGATALHAPPLAAQVSTFDRAVPCASGQGPRWGPHRVAMDTQGNVLAVGSFTNTVFVGNTALTAAGVRSEPDVFVAKLDVAGAYVWAVQAGGDLTDEVTAVAVDAAGDVVVTGYFDSYRMDFGPSGPVLFNSSARTEVFVAKYSGQTGRCLWARRAGGVNNDTPKAVSVNTLGEIYVAGNSISQTLDFGQYTLTNTRFGDAFIAKLTTNGSWVWARRAGTGNPNISNLIIDTAGLVYVSGTFGAPFVAFGNITLTTSLVVGSPSLTGSDLFIAKCDDAGNWVWAVQGFSSGQNLIDEIKGGALAQDHIGHLYLCGSYRSTSARFGPITLPNLSTMYPPSTGPPVPYTNNYPSDAFVARLDASTGNWQWVVRTGGTQEDDLGTVVADQQGRVYVAAGLSSSGKFDSPFAGGGRSRLAQLDGATGTWRWVLPADSITVRGLALDAMGKVWTAGFFSGARAAFGPVVVPQAGAGLETGYLARLGAGPLPLATKSLAAATVSMTVWPNPVGSGLVWVEGLAPGQAVDVLDALGRRVARDFMPASRRLRLAFATPLVAGVYVVRGGGQARRLVVE